MYITGLDLGSANTKAVLVEIDERTGKFNLVGALKQPSCGFRKGVLIDFEGALGSLKKIFSDLTKVSRKTVKNVYVNLNGAHIKCFHSRGVAAVSRADSEIQPDDIDRVSQAAEAVNFPPNYVCLHNITREFIVDEIGGIEDPLGMTGTRLELSSLVVGAFSPFVNNLVKCLERAGGSVEGVIFNPLASSRSVLGKQQKELGVLLIDIGFGTTSFAVYEENKIGLCGAIPLGSGNITNDIAIGFKTSVAVAESLKLKHGFALAKDISRREVVNFEETEADLKPRDVGRRFLAEIAEVRLVEILELIHNELKKSGVTAGLPSGVVLVGGGAKIPGLVELVKQEFKLPAQIGLPDLSGFEIKNAAYEELVNDPEFSAVIGLIRSSEAENVSRYEMKNTFLSRFGFLRRIFDRIMP